MENRKSARRRRKDGSKVKFGTILDGAIIDKLRLRAVMEDQPLNRIIEEAVLRYEDADIQERSFCVHALESALGLRFTISPDDLRIIMEEDVYNQ